MVTSNYLNCAIILGYFLPIYVYLGIKLASVTVPHDFYCANSLCVCFFMNKCNHIRVLFCAGWVLVIWITASLPSNVTSTLEASMSLPTWPNTTPTCADMTRECCSPPIVWTDTFHTCYPSGRTSSLGMYGLTHCQDFSIELHTLSMRPPLRSF